MQRSLQDPSRLFINWSSLHGTQRELGVGEVHVWHASLEERLAQTLHSVLSEDERIRADRFHFAKDRDHFVVARGLLRTILATYLNVDPVDLKFRYGAQGKPALLTSTKENPIEFNLSHSHGRALFAFSRDRMLGVDLEFIQDEFAGEDIAERFFSAAEVEALRSLSKSLKSQAFFNCWTRKEAYIKACGEGLSMPLDEFDVSLVPGDPAALLKNSKDPNEVLRWSMHSVPVESGYVGALVAEGSDVRPKYFYLS